VPCKLTLATKYNKELSKVVGVGGVTTASENNIMALLFHTKKLHMQEWADGRRGKMTCGRR
jgi:hypothetical protein